MMHTIRRPFISVEGGDAGARVVHGGREQHERGLTNAKKGTVDSLEALRKWSVSYYRKDARNESLLNCDKRAVVL